MDNAPVIIITNIITDNLRYPHIFSSTRLYKSGQDINEYIQELNTDLEKFRNDSIQFVSNLKNLVTSIKLSLVNNKVKFECVFQNINTGVMISLPTYLGFDKDTIINISNRNTSIVNRTAPNYISGYDPSNNGGSDNGGGGSDNGGGGSDNGGGGSDNGGGGSDNGGGGSDDGGGGSSDKDKPDPGKNNNGLIIGIVSVFALLVLLGAGIGIAIYLSRRKKREKEDVEEIDIIV